VIAGIGTDLAAVARFAGLIERQGLERVAKRFLAESEQADLLRQREPARFLAKRFAAKEALSKALGTGVRAPVLLTAIAVTHDELGKPMFTLAPELAAWVADRGIVRLHLSISDEQDHALAFVVAERA
jgi:holo-[acyl-carrier protein] synthase